MFKRTMSLLSLLMILAVVLAACGGTPAAPTDSAQAGASAAPAASEAPAAAPASPEASAAPEASEPSPSPEASTAASPEASAAPPTPTPVNVSTFDASAAQGRTVVRWFVGLGAGTQPEQITKQQEIVEEYNKSQDKLYLALDIVGNETAYEVLATQIAANNAPDIIGPVGYRGISSFQDQILDLSDLIQKNNVDLSEYDESLIKFYNVEGQGQLGLPFAVYPSFLFINKDLFDEADLPYPE